MASPPVPPPGSFQLRVLNRFTGLQNRIYRATGGRVAGKMRGAPILLVDHVGRKSGTERTNPLIYLDDPPNLVIVASAGGRAAHPAWWLNLQATPETTVQVGSERRRVRARAANAEERERLWPRLVALYGDYDAYAARTDREIPVVILAPVS